MSETTKSPAQLMNDLIDEASALSSSASPAALREARSL